MSETIDVEEFTNRTMCWMMSQAKKGSDGFSIPMPTIAALEAVSAAEGKECPTCKKNPCSFEEPDPKWRDTQPWLSPEAK